MSTPSELATAKKAEGNALFGAKDYAAAIEKYTEALALATDADSKKLVHVFYSNRSACYAALGKWPEASADGQACVAANPKFFKGYHRAGNAMLHTGEFKAGVPLVEKGLVHDPGNADLVSLLERLRAEFERAEKARLSGLSHEEMMKEEANQLFKAARFEDAIEKYTVAINAITDKDAKVYIDCLNNRAACYQQLSNFHAVVADASEVLERQPNNLKALLRRGLAFEGLEKYRSALADIRAVLAIDPTLDIANKAQHRVGGAVRALKAAGTSI